MSYNGYGMDNSFGAYAGQDDPSYLVTEYGAYGDYGASRDVSGAGGYKYRQYDDGRIKILSGASGVGSTLSSGSAWNAITAEIGPYPASGSASGEDKKVTAQDILTGIGSGIRESGIFQPSNSSVAPNFLSNIFGGSPAAASPGTPAPVAQPNNTWKWVVGGVAVVALLGGVTYAATRKK